MSVIDDLKAAKAVMVQHGRCRNVLRDYDNNTVCILGALGVATGSYSMTEIERSDRAQAMVRELVKHLEQGLIPTGRGIPIQSARLAVFNDSLDTSTQDILNLFDKALADLGGMA